MTNIHLSVVIPLYNEEANVAPLFKRLLPVLESLDLVWEVICVDDGSADKTYPNLLERLSSLNALQIIKLSRNFGKEAALTAGLDIAQGETVLIMDGDLQHPPEIIPEFLKVHQSGTDIVYGLRTSRDTEGTFRSILSKWYYKVFSKAAEIEIPANAGDFRLLSRRAVDALKSLPEQNRFMKGLYSWIGFSQQAVPYEVAERSAGRSKWSLRQLLSYAWNGLVSFSAVPLRVWSVFGFVIAGCSLVYACVIVITALLTSRDVPGYPTLATAIFFLGGLQLLSIGVIGEYIARIFAEAKRRPVYIIEEHIGRDSQHND